MNKSKLLSALKFVLSLFNLADKSAWFKFAYTWSDNTSVMGIVRGDLQADQNTIINLSNVLAFVRNADGVFISEFLDIPILGANNHLTLDGSSLEFSFTSNQGDVVKFFGSSSSFWFATCLIIKKVRVIAFEPINSAQWNMVQCFLDESQYHLINQNFPLREIGLGINHNSSS